MTNNETACIRSGPLSAEVSLVGAEMLRLHHTTHGDLLWSRDTSVWAGVSPILFPIVGKAADDRIRIGSRAYRMPQHGFAATRRFDVVDHSSALLTCSLGSDVQTLSMYPFEFELSVSYRLSDSALIMEAEVRNPGPVSMPASFGFHPAFRWPLHAGRPKTDYTLTFPKDQNLEIRRLLERRLSATTQSLLLDKGRLHLQESLFENGAAIMLERQSNSLTYGAPRAPFALQLEMENLPHLGLWMKPGHDYLCVEPWQGFSDPEGFEGVLFDKPGVFLLSPGARRQFRLAVNIVPSSG